jgi:hypothetical protein
VLDGPESAAGRVVRPVWHRPNPKVTLGRYAAKNGTDLAVNANPINTPSLWSTSRWRQAT